jgi:hypothetical protein
MELAITKAVTKPNPKPPSPSSLALLKSSSDRLLKETSNLITPKHSTNIMAYTTPFLVTHICPKHLQSVLFRSSVTMYQATQALMTEESFPRPIVF